MSDEKETTTIATRQSADLLWSESGFGHAQRVAKCFVESDMIPRHMKTVPNATIALLMAKRLGEDPMVVMQNLYVVHGNPGWNASYIIAKANMSGVFRGRINWEESGTGADLSVTAFATLAETGDRVDFEVSMAMARAEGWVKNPKYNTIPKLMLRYRSATLLVRLFCPEVMLGLQTKEELEDVTVVSATVESMETDTPAPTLTAALEESDDLPAIVAEVKEAREAPQEDAQPPSPPPLDTLPPEAGEATEGPTAGSRATIAEECRTLEARMRSTDVDEARRVAEVTKDPSGKWGLADLTRYRDALEDVFEAVNNG